MSLLDQLARPAGGGHSTARNEPERGRHGNHPALPQEPIEHAAHSRLETRPYREGPGKSLFKPPASTNEVGPGKGVTRDRWGRPLIIPPDGGKTIAYARATTFAGALDTKDGLIPWAQEMTARGLVERGDLLMAVSNAQGDTARIRKAAKDAAEHAGASAKANLGTQIHEATERLDRGETIIVPSPYDTVVDAYREAIALAGLDPVEQETFVVNDDLQVAGTFDRIYELDGKRYIGDLKTGKDTYGAGAWAIQLALYANSVRYEVGTGIRKPLDVETDRAILVHAPAHPDSPGFGTATVYWLDIKAGWESAALARLVRDWRKRKDWLTRFDTPAAETPAKTLTGTTKTEILHAAIAACSCEASLTKLWADNKASWRPEHTQAAKARLAQLADTSR